MLSVRTLDLWHDSGPWSRRDGVGHIRCCRVVCDDERDGCWPTDHFGVYAERRDEPLDAAREVGGNSP